jgi:hypothetical protein
MSADNFFDSGFLSHTFSDISSIEQGSTDLEYSSRLSQDNVESVFRMSQKQIQRISSNSSEEDEIHQQHLASIVDAYSNLTNMPKDSLGLRVYDESGKNSDSDELLRSISKSLTLDVKINNMVVSDVFRNSKEKKSNISSFKISSSKKEIVDDLVAVNPIASSKLYYTKDISFPIVILGYIIDRYWVTPDGYTKQKTYFVEDPLVTNFIDKFPLYGVSYTYSIRSVFSVKMLSRTDDSNDVDVVEVYVSSKPIPTYVDCFEYVPPPPPENLKFTFDYSEQNLLVQWDPPINPQKDIKQYQIFKRKSINEPFELIAQYGFDTTTPGWPDNQKYRTGEIVDANNFELIPQEYRYLVKNSETLVCIHRDEDFSIDTEFFQNEPVIYAVCSIDAHGMISNYSAQYEVGFDSYKNRITTKLICDTGSPRQYPNMNLRVDAFKDAIKVSGDETKEISIYFSPEYLKIRDDDNKFYKIVEAKTPAKNSSPYYVFQLINLDNQKSQVVRINIDDPTNLTSS